MALIYNDPAQAPTYGTPEFGKMMEGYFALNRLLKEEGAWLGGDGLQGVHTATSVRVKDGKVETMDGPLNRAVVMAEAGQAGRAATELDALAGAMEDYQPYHAARAFVLGRAGRRDESLAAYDRAIALAPTAADARFLGNRRHAAAH